MQRSDSMLVVSLPAASAYQLNARLHAPTRTRTVRMGAINFEGNSVSELAVPAAARGLDEWLGSTASDATLLGTPDYEPDGDLWICRQPPVAWSPDNPWQLMPLRCPTEVPASGYFQPAPCGWRLCDCGPRAPDPCEENSPD